MRYTVRKSIVYVVGEIWWPIGATAAMTYELNSYDVANATDENGQLTRDSVQVWVDTQAGDFSAVLDWSASLEPADGSDTVELAWADEDSELTFNDCMFAGDE